MSQSHFMCSLSILAMSLGLSIPAVANTVTYTPGMFSPQSGITTTDFNSGMPSSYVFSGTSGVTNTTTAQHLAPVGDSTNYAWVGGGSITATFAAPTSYFGLYWGSPDGYNSLILTDTNGVKTTYIPGQSPLLTKVFLPSQYVNFFDTGAAWTSATFTSTFNAFEFDNVAVTGSASAIPEPVSLTIFGLSLLAVAGIRRRKSA